MCVSHKRVGGRGGNEAPVACGTGTVIGKVMEKVTKEWGGGGSYTLASGIEE